MSLHSYHLSFHLTRKDYPISALIFAAMRKADPHNQYRLRTTFPELWEEFENRNAAGCGVLLSDGVEVTDDLLGWIDRLQLEGE